MKNIILIGLPGCGKTTVGEILAKRLKKEFIDLDRFIEATQGKTIPEIFEGGEQAFRDLESAAAREMAKREGIVLSAGGGAVLREENMKCLKENGILFFIDRPPEKIAKDIAVSHRPLLKDGPGKIYSLYRQRLPLYRKFASYEVQNAAALEDVVAKLEKIVALHQ